MDRAESGIGVKLPKKKAKKPTVLLTFPQIRRVDRQAARTDEDDRHVDRFRLDEVCEALALRSERHSGDRIVIDERLYDDDLDDPKTLHGNREVPFDRRALLKELLHASGTRRSSRKPEDFVFATRNGTPTERRNVLRHLKTAAKALELSNASRLRSFRTMHAQFDAAYGARAEVTRDSMGHSECATSLEIYSKTWWTSGRGGVSGGRSGDEVR